jgi:hypothetical protein
LRHEHDGVTLPLFAELLATIRHFGAGKQLEVVERMGLRREQWEAASKAWMEDLAAELRAARGEDLAKAFGNAFGACQKRLADTLPELEALGPRPVPSPALPGALAVPVGGATGFAAGAAVDLDETSAVAVLRDDPTLPFVLPSFELDERLRVPSATPHQPQSGETTEVPTLRDDQQDPTLPFLKVASMAGGWTVESYASLCAELAVFPEHRGRLLHRYGLQDDAARRALDAQWSGRMARDAALGNHFQQLYSAYREYLIRRA